MCSLTPGKDQPYAKKHTQICTPSVGMNAVRPTQTGCCATSVVDFELAEDIPSFPRILGGEEISLHVCRSLRNDNKMFRQYNLRFQNFIVVAFPTKKNSVLDDFPLCPQGPPPPSKTENFIFIVVSPSLSLVGLQHIEAASPTQNPEIPKKHRVYANFFEKFARTFALFPVTRVRNPMEIVQINLFT